MTLFMTCLCIKTAKVSHFLIISLANNEAALHHQTPQIIMDKYTVPNIPSTQNILEDISDMDIVQLHSKPAKLQEGNETLQNAHACYLNFRQLQGDLLKQDVLNTKLDELNQKLVENIANMKKQT